jgi:hypothetical protein
MDFDPCPHRTAPMTAGPRAGTDMENGTGWDLFDRKITDAIRPVSAPSPTGSGIRRGFD